jgi:putative PIN family toxin of toxin-antitoxin system
MNEPNNKPRVVIDTNLVISGIISANSAPSKLFTSWTQDNFHWILTEETFNEIKEVLSREKIKTKYHIDETETQSFLDNLAISVKFIAPVPKDALPIHCRDPKDDIILACAIAGSCDYLITGDEDLLVLNGKKELGKLQIIKAAEFLQINWKNNDL